MNEGDAACQVIEHQQRTRCDIVRQGHSALRPVARRQVLKKAHDIVCRVPNEPTGERHTRYVGLRLRRARQRLTQSGQELRARGGQGPPLGPVVIWKLEIDLTGGVPDRGVKVASVG